jgi:hypothetical protein
MLRTARAKATSKTPPKFMSRKCHAESAAAASEAIMPAAAMFEQRLLVGGQRIIKRLFGGIGLFQIGQPLL